MSLFSKREKGIVFVISAPSGTGKSSLVAQLLVRHPEKFARVITSTTRAPRRGEEDGKDYYFYDPQVFQKKKEQGEFLEVESMYGYEYGTLKEEVYRHVNSGQHVFLVIGVGGALQLMKKMKAVYIFIAPPNHQELEKRIRARNKDGEEEITRRLQRAEEELAQQSVYDYLIVNEIFQESLNVLQSIIVAEDHKVLRVGNEKI